jgi:TPR repeat protein
MNKKLISLIWFIFFVLNLFAEDSFYVEYKKREYLNSSELFKTSCDNGDIDSCYTLGIMYLNGYGIKPNYLKARDLFTKACNDKNSDGCFNLGNMYKNGQGVKQDYIKAKDLFLKACNGGNTEGCYNLSAIHYNKHNIKQDYVEAKDLFIKAKDLCGKACDLGFQDSCEAYSSFNR